MFLANESKMNAAPHPAAIPKKMQTVGTRRDLRRSLETRVNFWHAAIVSFFSLLSWGRACFSAQ
jgi:hypothetical protein